MALGCPVRQSSPQIERQTQKHEVYFKRIRIPCSQKSCSGYIWEFLRHPQVYPAKKTVERGMALAARCLQVNGCRVALLQRRKQRGVFDKFGRWMGRWKKLQPMDFCTFSSHDRIFMGLV